MQLFLSIDLPAQRPHRRLTQQQAIVLEVDVVHQQQAGAAQDQQPGQVAAPLAHAPAASQAG